MSKQVVTVHAINKALAARGVEERLRAGNGFYYFCNGDAIMWPASCVYVYRAAQLTLKQWMDIYDEMSKRA